MNPQNLFVYSQIASRSIMIKVQPNSSEKLFDLPREVSVSREASGQNK